MCGAERHALPDGVQQDAGHPHTPIMLDGAARTAQEAADSLGVQLGQIAKSVIFKRKEDGVAVLVVTSGDRRVDEKKLAALVGKVGRADADFVKAHTGFTSGGVSPVAHLYPPVTVLDQDLWRFDEVWAAAGHPHAVFRLHPQDLPGLTGASAAVVVQDGPDAEMQTAKPLAPVAQEAP
jgi:prolyl-tRNA editing enzyme YbaK/EbsC (Cys-tRNA(Pro) deacylase)